MLKNTPFYGVMADMLRRLERRSRTRHPRLKTTHDRRAAPVRWMALIIPWGGWHQFGDYCVELGLLVWWCGSVTLAGTKKLAYTVDSLFSGAYLHCRYGSEPEVKND
jgi:hypothetical protein